ncbi:MAG: 4-phosphoerythronate dehydrogenase [Bacteroidales bacterium]|nr:4-phosphoerythronate dehydrogenase [Bacteroidales bacterium]
MIPPKILVDNTIPYIEGVLEPYADVTYLDAREFTKDTVRDADILVVRTRTKCGSSLLDGSSVKMIATATVGTDHIELDWCKAHGIQVANASGCHAGGVMNYVFSALYATAARKSIHLNDKVFGIIGAGHVGSLVQKMAQKLGFKVLVCDTPRAEDEGQEGFCELDELLRNSDIVSLHVPLNDKTRLMADEEFFNLMKGGAFFINASRGGIVDENALKEACPRLGPVIIDTWNNEPDIDKDLMDKVDIATPHIAGYTVQGKLIGTSLAVRAVANFLGIDELKDFYHENEDPELNPIKLDLIGKNQGEIASLIQYNYPIFTDDFMLRMIPDNFEAYRSEYKYRREFYF